jgi:hypothetical protein
LGWWDWKSLLCDGPCRRTCPRRRVSTRNLSRVFLFNLSSGYWDIARTKTITQGAEDALASEPLLFGEANTEPLYYGNATWDPPSSDMRAPQVLTSWAHQALACGTHQALICGPHKSLTCRTHQSSDMSDPPGSDMRAMRPELTVDGQL